MSLNLSHPRVFTYYWWGMAIMIIMIRQSSSSSYSDYTTSYAHSNASFLQSKPTNVCMHAKYGRDKLLSTHTELLQNSHRVWVCTSCRWMMMDGINHYTWIMVDSIIRVQQCGGVDQIKLWVSNQLPAHASTNAPGNIMPSHPSIQPSRLSYQVHFYPPKSLSRLSLRRLLCEEAFY